MSDVPTCANLLLDIESRQDEVLRQLTELEQRLDRVLAECAGFCRPSGQGRPSLAALPIDAAPHHALPAAAPIATLGAPSIPAIKVA